MQNKNSDDLLPIIGFGLLTLAIATAPIWLPAISGNEPESCECGVKIGQSGISPSCKCYY